MILITRTAGEHIYWNAEDGSPRQSRRCTINTHAKKLPNSRWTMIQDAMNAWPEKPKWVFKVYKIENGLVQFGCNRWRAAKLLDKAIQIDGLKDQVSEYLRHSDELKILKIKNNLITYRCKCIATYHQATRAIADIRERSKTENATYWCALLEKIERYMDTVTGLKFEDDRFFFKLKDTEDSIDLEKLHSTEGLEHIKEAANKWSEILSLVDDDIVYLRIDTCPPTEQVISVAQLHDYVTNPSPSGVWTGWKPLYAALVNFERIDKIVDGEVHYTVVLDGALVTKKRELRDIEDWGKFAEQDTTKAHWERLRVATKKYMKTVIKIISIDKGNVEYTRDGSDQHIILNDLETLVRTDGPLWLPVKNALMDWAKLLRIEGDKVIYNQIGITYGFLTTTTTVDNLKSYADSCFKCWANALEQLKTFVQVDKIEDGRAYYTYVADNRILTNNRDLNTIDSWGEGCEGWLADHWKLVVAAVKAKLAENKTEDSPIILSVEGEVVNYQVDNKKYGCSLTQLKEMNAPKLKEAVLNWAEVVRIEGNEIVYNQITTTWSFLETSNTLESLKKFDNSPYKCWKNVLEQLKTFVQIDRIEGSKAHFTWVKDDRIQHGDRDLEDLATWGDSCIIEAELKAHWGRVREAVHAHFEMQNKPIPTAEHIKAEKERIKNLKETIKAIEWDGPKIVSVVKDMVFYRDGMAETNVELAWLKDEAPKEWKPLKDAVLAWREIVGAKGDTVIYRQVDSSFKLIEVKSTVELAITQGVDIAYHIQIHWVTGGVVSFSYWSNYQRKFERQAQNINFIKQYAGDFWQRVQKALDAYMKGIDPCALTPENYAELGRDFVEEQMIEPEYIDPVVAEQLDKQRDENGLTSELTWDSSIKFDATAVEMSEDWRGHKAFGCVTCIDGKRILSSLIFNARGTYQGYCDELKGDHEIFIHSDSVYELVGKSHRFTECNPYIMFQGHKFSLNDFVWELINA